MMAEQGAPRYVLIGPMGAGKSTVAAVLAARLGVEPADSDHLVERAAGKPVQQIFIDDGEPAFRALEREVVARLLGDASQAVVSLGGGAVLDPATQQDLRDCGAVVVFLDVPAAEASRRVGLGVGRPLLLGNPRATWIRLLEERRPTYEQVATVVVDTGGKSPEQVVEEILAQPIGEKL